jgi:hypothetical protein
MNKSTYSKDVCDRFWSKIIIPKDYENECWLWNAYTKPSGEGEFYISKNPRERCPAPRFSYQYYNGMLPYRKHKVYQTCKNKLCVNPHHLVLKDSEAYIAVIIWDKVIIPNDYVNGCWEWTGTKKKGYAYFNEHRLSRFIYALHNKEKLPDDLVIRHKCDNRGCLNPNHIEKGTPQDNVYDRVKRNRSAKGQTHGMSKLTDQIICDAFNKILSGKLTTINNVAKYCEIHRSIIEKIFRQIHWKHISNYYTQQQWQQILSIKQ